MLQSSTRLRFFKRNIASKTNPSRLDSSAFSRIISFRTRPHEHFLLIRFSFTLFWLIRLLLSIFVCSVKMWFGSSTSGDTNVYELSVELNGHRFVWAVNVVHRWNAMSSIRKSASFRSRIPVRRTKPLPRRCYSPPPLSTVSSSAEYRSSHSHKSQDTSQAAATTTASNKYKQKHPIWLPQQLNTSASGPTMAANKVATATYSSSSYSSSDESQESEAPLQVNTHIQYILTVCIHRNTPVGACIDLYRCYYAPTTVSCL